MKKFDEPVMDFAKCRQEVLELQALLANHPVLNEQKHILPFFRQRRYLSALCGLYNPQIRQYDRVAWEFDLFGDFVCDLAVGDSQHKTYTFLEFEDAGPGSLFVQEGRKATRAWSPRFDHGFSQVIDWFYKLHDRRNSDDCLALFGKRAIDFVGVLVAGRDQYLAAGERLRLEWRREHAIINSKRILCVTYDELVNDLLSELNGTAQRLQATG